jgi:glycosyltransferase involved in cell wall biosynthesis
LTGLAFVQGRRQGLALPPVGVNAHGYEMFQRCMGLGARLGQVLMRPPHRKVTLQADLVFSFSGRIREIVDKTIGVPPDRVRVIPNAVDVSWVAPSARPSGRPRKFVFVGRHERRKGVPELNEALRGLDGCDWAMDFVGPIPEEKRLLDPRIRYLGVVREESDLIRIYDQCDSIVVPSFAEGMPTVLIEAMARGLVPIATDVGAVREPVAAAQGIVLASPSPQLIRSAMRSVALMSDDELVARKSAALAASRQFTWEQVAPQVVHAIEDAIRRSGSISDPSSATGF